MSFANVETKTYSPNPNFKRIEYMNLSSGGHRIRILDKNAKDVYTHYLNKATILCLGEDCPICANNKKLIMQFKDTFREQSGYNKSTRRYFVNVFDKTPAKVCTKCEKEYKNINTQVCSCGELLPEAKPLNKVKVLSKGVSLFEQLEAINNAILDDNGEPIGIENYDMNIIVNGSGRDVIYTPIPDTTKREPVEIKEDALFDLDKAVIVLTPEEMLDVQRGVSLKDIFASKKSKQIEAEVSVQVPEEVLQDVQAKVNALFGS